MALWFLPDQAIEKNSNFSLFTSSDIEDCLDFLQKPDSSISISQLGEGQCSSKVQMLDFGSLLVMIEDHSHVMEIDGKIPAGSFLFAFGLGPESSLFVDGTNLGNDTLRVSPPCANCFEVFRPGGAIALFAIDQDVLLSHEALIPEVADWLATRGRRTEFIRSARLTTRLRQDMEVLIQCAGALKRQAYLDALGDLAISGLANALSFEWLAPPTPDFLTSSRSFERFVSAREMLMSQMQSSLHSDALASLSTKSSRRTLEIAFKSNVNMGPAAYARVIRLNSARQKLLDGDRLNDSIGDIAAEEGFWEWSRFSKYYHKLFGELPSQTRGTRFPKGGRQLPLRR